MTKKDLVNRWKSSDGQELLKDILDALKKRQDLSEIPGLTKFENRWDLRGAVLSIVEDQRTIGNKDRKLTQKFGSLKLKKVKLENVNLSYADISYGMFQECYFDNCLFNETKAREIHVSASDFNTCVFNKASFSYSFMNRNIGINAGSFRNCKFLNSNLKETIFSFPIMDNCVFEDCNLYATNFDGSRMRNTKFIGTVDSSWFRGYSTSAQKSALWLFNKINPKDYPNKMENVDFSEAKLEGVSFSNSINLSHTYFPDSDNYILIKKPAVTFLDIKKEILSKWTGEDQRVGLHMIENVYYTNEHQQQDMIFIDKFTLISVFNMAFANKLFDLIHKSTY